jgi:hypothetical protein
MNIICRKSNFFGERPARIPKLAFLNLSILKISSFYSISSTPLSKNFCVALINVIFVEKLVQFNIFKQIKKIGWAKYC